MTGPVVARSNGVVVNGRSTNKAHFRFPIFSTLLTSLYIPSTFFLLGIFGQATTEAAPTAKTGRWWFQGIWSNCRVQRLPGNCICIGSSSLSSSAGGTTSTSASLSIRGRHGLPVFVGASTTSSWPTSGSIVTCTRFSRNDGRGLPYCGCACRSHMFGDTGE